MKSKVARRFQVTIPEEVRDETNLRVGDLVDVRSQDGKVIIEKIGGEWEEVMKDTKGAWRNHPAFKGLKEATDVVDWMRKKKRDR